MAKSTKTQGQGKAPESKQKTDAAQGELDALEASKVAAQGELDALEASKVTAQGELDALEASKETAQGEIDALEVSKETAQGEVEEKPKAVKTLKSRPTFEYKGKLYAFTQSAPDNLNVYGDVEPIADIIKDKDTMEYLIDGRSGFVCQVTKKQK